MIGKQFNSCLKQKEKIMVNCADIMKVKLEIMEGFGISKEELKVYCPKIPQQQIECPTKIIKEIVLNTKVLLNKDTITK